MHVNVALLKEQLHSEQLRANRAEAGLTDLVNLQSRVNVLESELERWSDMIEVIPGAQTRDDVPRCIAELQRWFYFLFFSLIYSSLLSNASILHVTLVLCFYIFHSFHFIALNLRELMKRTFMAHDFPACLMKYGCSLADSWWTNRSIYILRAAVAATAKTGDATSQISELKIAVERAERSKLLAEARASTLQEEVADAMMNAARLERKVSSFQCSESCNSPLQYRSSSCDYTWIIKGNKNRP